MAEELLGPVPAELLLMTDEEEARVVILALESNGCIFTVKGDKLVTYGKVPFFTEPIRRRILSLAPAMARVVRLKVN